MPDQKIAKQRTLMRFMINRQRDIQHLASVKRLETAKKHPSSRVAEVNKFGINHQKQATHVAVSGNARDNCMVFCSSRGNETGFWNCNRFGALFPMVQTTLL